MHEAALLDDLRRKVEELSRANGGAPIVRARVSVGALSHLDEPRLRELWARAMVDGPAARCALEVELLPSLDDPRATAVVLRSVTFDADASGRRSPAPSSPSAR